MCIGTVEFTTDDIGRKERESVGWGVGGGYGLWGACGMLVGCLWGACGMLVGCLWGACGMLVSPSRLRGTIDGPALPTGTKVVNSLLLAQLSKLEPKS